MQARITGGATRACPEIACPRQATQALPFVEIRVGSQIPSAPKSQVLTKQTELPPTITVWSHETNQGDADVEQNAARAA